MEVDNSFAWKETHIGDTPIFHWTMIIGARIVPYLKVIGPGCSDWGLPQNPP